MTCLVDSSIVVTGAAGGIGSACVDAFVKAGAKVIAADICLSGKVLEERYGPKTCRFVQCDLGNENAVRDMINLATNAFGSLNVLVNNGAVLVPTAPLHETTNDEFERLVSVNLRGLFYCCKYAFAQLRASQGSIINISSMAGIHGEKHHAMYSAMKGAMNALTRSMAVDYGEFGIRCNAVCPSSVLTPNVDSMISALPNASEIIQLRKQNNPLGYTAKPEEIAAVVVFLASPLASYVNGVLLPVAGGSDCGYGIKY